MKILNESLVIDIFESEKGAMRIFFKTLLSGDTGVQFYIDSKNSTIDFNKEMLSELITVLNKAIKKLWFINFKRSLREVW